MISIMCEKPLWQIYRCRHRSCGLFYVKSDKRWPMTPYCPTRIELESDSQHPVEYVGSITYEQIQWHKGHLDNHIRYTCTERGASLECCEFISLETSEVYCPCCGGDLPDAYRQQVDPKRWVVGSTENQLKRLRHQLTTAEAEAKWLRKRIETLKQQMHRTEAV